MATPEFLTQFLLVLVVATFVAVTFERFKLPTILGYLLAGVFIGPHGFGLLTDTAQIHLMADLGVILLMLTIGLEFSFDRLKGLGRLAVFGGSLQILLSVGIGFAVALWRGWTLYEGFFLGSVIALSSTAIVFKYLMDRGELDSYQGRVAISILIFQDLAVAPLMIFLNGMGDSSGKILVNLEIAFLRTIVLIAGVIIFSRYVLPTLLRRIAGTRNREVLFLSAVVICLGTAWMSDQLGLSFAIGAFFAGLMFANTDFGHQLIGDIVPFRRIFVSIFFVSIGLLFDAGFALENMFLVVAMVGLVIVVNFVLMTALIILFGYPPRIAMAAGIILCQIGEFSFLLIETARETGGVDIFIYRLLLATAFLTMLITPLLFALVPLVLKVSEKIAVLGFHPSEKESSHDAAKAMKDHVILCGFGPAGRDLAMTFREESIPFLLVEANPSQVQEARRQGLCVIYGDAANEEVMQRAGIERARALVVSFYDPTGMMQIVRGVQRLNTRVMIAVRTRYEQDMPRLYDLGADIVIMEEWEASHELNRALLTHFGIAAEHIDRHLERIRARKELAVEEAIMRRGQNPGHLR